MQLGRQVFIMSPFQVPSPSKEAVIDLDLRRFPDFTLAQLLPPQNLATTYLLQISQNL